MLSFKGLLAGPINIAAGFAISVSWSFAAIPPLPKDIATIIETPTACFVIQNIATGETKVHNAAQCRVAKTPNSTFKILHSLIALELGVVTQSTVFEWDGKKRTLPTWERDLTLEKAIQLSAVPVFQEIAQRIGPKRMKKWLVKARFGNQKVGSEIDRFWLDGPLKISPFDQIKFMSRLYSGRLPFRRRVLDDVRRMLVLKYDSKSVISGKTGSTWDGKKFVWGWFVGHLARGKEQYVFVTYIEGHPEKSWGQQAKKISFEMLKKMRLL